MRNSGLVSTSKPSMFSLVGVMIGIATLIVMMAASVGSRPASATPVYAGQTGRQCAYCHVNPAGGGNLTAQGKRFQARGHKL